MTSDIVVDTSLKVHCGKAALAEQLGIVGRGVSARPTVQVFGGVLMQAENDRIELSATDMEISVRTGLDANVSGEGSAGVPARLVTDIVRLLPGEDVGPGCSERLLVGRRRPYGRLPLQRGGRVPPRRQAPEAIRQDRRSEDPLRRGPRR
jgi:hypothetical protein